VIKRILGLGTFPSVKPVHGGQRRAAAFRTFYRTIGIEYVYTCIYDGNHYTAPLVGPDDIPLIAGEAAEAPVSLIGDLLSGRQGATHDASFRHFLHMVEQLEPDAIQLEQPFMWPLAKRLRETLGARTLPLIYSSYNVEAPLKDAILLSGGVPQNVRRRICDSIEQMEAEICREAMLVICVTASEREHYLQHRSEPRDVIVVPNGVDRPPGVIKKYAPGHEVFQGRPFAFMVGSAYPPNIEGFCRYIIKGGAFMVPPVKSIAVCGGLCDGIANHPVYQEFLAANSRRIHFFPTIDDSELWSIKTSCHVVALPIATGAGSNLKTAEALTLGKWIVATPTALRGFEAFLDAEGLIVADDPTMFRRAIGQTLRSPPLTISDASRTAREALYWDRGFADSGLAPRVLALIPG
jgi:glycosyltransferase involved in cell wall biosynthesis